MTDFDDAPWSATLIHLLHDEQANMPDEIERLRAENERLRGALKTLAEPRDHTFIGDPWAFYDDMTAYARAALGEGDPA